MHSWGPQFSLNLLASVAAAEAVGVVDSEDAVDTVDMVKAV